MPLQQCGSHFNRIIWCMVSETVWLRSAVSTDSGLSSLIKSFFFFFLSYWKLHLNYILFILERLSESGPNLPATTDQWVYRQMTTGLYTKYYRKLYAKKDREKYGVMQWIKNIVHLTQLQVVGLLQHRQHLSLLQLCLRPSLSVWSLLRSTPCPMFIAHS